MRSNKQLRTIASVEIFRTSTARVLFEQPSAGLRVIEADPHRDSRWLSFVEAHADASIYHHPAWLNVIEEEYGQRRLHLACEAPNGEILAIMPMLYTRGLPVNIGAHLTRRRLTSLPRTPVAGPLSVDGRATAALIEAAMRQAQRDSVALEVKTHGPEPVGCPEGVSAVPWRDSYVLRLPQNSSRPYRVPDSHSRAGIKWAVHKAERLGVRVRAAESKADLEIWYRLYLQTMRRHVIPPRPYRFFSALWEHLKPRGMMELLLAEKPAEGGSTTIAGSLFLMFNRTAFYAFNGADPEEFSLRPNDVILWSAIHAMAGRGFEFLDLGEVPEGNEGLAKFKSKWGSERVRLHRLYSPARSQSGHRADAPGPGVLALMDAIWQRLPLPLTVWLGDLAYSYL
jgi:hypothetical protein